MVPPLLGLPLDCGGPFFKERSGGVCDTTGNTVRQGYCYTCLAIGGGFFGRVTKVMQPVRMVSPSGTDGTGKKKVRGF